MDPVLNAPEYSSVIATGLSYTMKDWVDHRSNWVGQAWPDPLFIGTGTGLAGPVLPDHFFALKH